MKNNPKVDVLLKGGTNDHFTTRASLFDKELVVPAQTCCGREKYRATGERTEVKGKDGVERTYRVFTLKE